MEKCKILVDLQAANAFVLSEHFPFSVRDERM